PDAHTHDGLRGVPGVFDATVRAVAAACVVGLPVQINTSIGAGTAGNLPAMGRLVAAIRPVLWSVFFVVPVRRAQPAQQGDAHTAERLFHWLYEWSGATGIAVKTTAAPAYRRVVVQREVARALANPNPGHRRRRTPPAINDGKGFLFISHTGDVQ